MVKTRYHVLISVKKHPEAHLLAPNLKIQGEKKMSYEFFLVLGWLAVWVIFLKIGDFPRFPQIRGGSQNSKVKIFRKSKKAWRKRVITF